MYTLQTLCAFLGLAVPDQDKSLGNFVLDSRMVQPGDVFLAVCGTQVDGHDYIEQALDQGAALVIGSQDRELSDTYRCVPDVQAAITQLAKGWRRVFTGKLIAITGTVGKTSTKEMLYHVLRTWGVTHRSMGNYNNAWGVPLSILNTPLVSEYVIIEIGATHPGNIASHMEWLRPDVGVITKIGIGHTEFMEDAQGVARCKYEMIDTLPSASWAVMRDEDAIRFDRIPREPCIRVGKDISVSDTILSWQQITAKVTLHDTLASLVQQKIGTLTMSVTGESVLENALLVTGIACLFKMPLENILSALRSYAPYKGRGVVFKYQDTWVIDESYNANPTSMQAAIDNALCAPSPRALVVGDMLELGPNALDYHKDLIDYIASKDIDVLITKGPLMAMASVSYGKTLYQNISLEECMEVIDRHALRTIMLKGSQGIGLYTWVKALQKRETL